MSSASAGSRLAHLLAMFAAAWRTPRTCTSTFEPRGAGAVIRASSAGRSTIAAWDGDGWAAAVVGSTACPDPRVMDYLDSCGPAAGALRASLRKDEHVCAFIWTTEARAGSIGDTKPLSGRGATRQALEELRWRPAHRIVTDEQAELALRLAPAEPAHRVMTPEEGAMVLAPKPLRTARVPDAHVPWLAEQLASMGIDWDWREALRVAGNVEKTHRQRESGVEGQLLVAARDGDVARVISALDAGAKIDAKASRGRRDRWFPGDTPLMAAITGRHTEVVELLLARGADPNVEGGVFSPLHQALWCRQEHLIEPLLRAGADPKRERHHGALVSQAAKNGSDVALRLLVAAGAAPPAARPPR